jgi:uncharacterized protein (TIGR03437 family)
MKWDSNVRGHNTLALAVALVLPPAGWGQKPVISPGGVVSAADYAGGSPPAGSIGSIFGKNLAAATVSATSVPLPTSLGGTTVTIDGVAVPLFFVSPGQINFQAPTYAVSDGSGTVVTTAAGVSDAYPSDFGGPSYPAVFAQNASGCGPAAALNVAADGSVSLNSPSDSVSPGSYLEVFGTGMSYLPTDLPTDGVPTPVRPLMTGYSAAGVYDFDWVYPAPYTSQYNWAGRAPGLVGVDQFNVLVPPGVREGCAVPLRVFSGDMSQPVTVAIRSGGGPCVDPPEQGYGQITWQKAENIAASGAVTAAESVTVSLQESPGKQTPAPPALALTVATAVYHGPSCPIPGFRSLDAGTVTAQAAGAAPTVLASAPLPQPNQVSGLTVYQAALPAGTIQGGNFTVSAIGGADVSAFQSTVTIGPEIHLTSDPTSIAVGCNDYRNSTISWTGGDPKAWVTVKLLSPAAPSHDYDSYRLVGQGRVSDGGVAIVGDPYFGSANPCVYYPTPMVLEVAPDPSAVPALSATGLSLGGQHTWKYLYYFTAQYN